MQRYVFQKLNGLIQRNPAEEVLQIFHHHGSINSTFEAVDQEVRKICQMLSKPEYRFTPQLLFFLDYTLRELFNNAVEHGNQLQHSKLVQYSVSYQNMLLEIIVRDEGFGFEWPIANLNLLSFEDCRNRGLYSVKAMGFDLVVKCGEVVARLEMLRRQYLMQSEEK